MINFIFTIIGGVCIYGAFKTAWQWFSGAEAVADMPFWQMVLIFLLLFIIGAGLLYFGFIKDMRKGRAGTRPAGRSSSGSGRRPRRTAYWTRRTHLFQNDVYVCSACGIRTDRPYKICPHCKALMNGSKYDPSWVDEAEFMDEIFED